MLLKVAAEMMLLLRRRRRRRWRRRRRRSSARASKKRWKDCSALNPLLMARRCCSPPSLASKAELLNAHPPSQYAPPAVHPSMQSLTTALRSPAVHPSLQVLTPARSSPFPTGTERPKVARGRSGLRRQAARGEAQAMARVRACALIEPGLRMDCVLIAP